MTSLFMALCCSQDHPCKGMTLGTNENNDPSQSVTLIHSGPDKVILDKIVVILGPGMTEALECKLGGGPLHGFQTTFAVPCVFRSAV